MKTMILCAALLSSGLAQAEFKIPAMKETTLDNGLKVIYIPQNEVPMVEITVAVRAGSALDGKNWGLASLTSAGVDLGTKSYTKKQIEDTFDRNAFNLQSGISKEHLTLTVSSASEDVQKLMPYLGELVRYPTYPAKEVDKLRDRSVSQLRKAKESPNEIGTEVFQRVYYGAHPYGSPSNGVADTLAKLKASDLQAFHKAYFQPQISAIVVSGDFDPKIMQELIAKEFASWKRGNAAPAEVKNPVPAIAETEVLLLDKPDAHETTFRIGGKGVEAFSQDWAKLEVINTILGGRFTSLLNEALRIRSGYTYGARSRFNDYRSSGTFFISTFTANETTFKTLDLALETYKGFLKNGIDQKTLDSAKAYVKGQFPPRYETLSSLNDLAIELWVYGVSLDAFNKFESEVNSLTLDEANQLIKTRFPSDKLEILLIGKASDIAAQAKKYGKFRQLPLARVDSPLPL